MPIDPQYVGTQYGPFKYEVGLEKMREFAYAIAGGHPGLGYTPAPEGLNPLLHDERVAQDGPHGAVVAFPTFAVTFAIAPFAAAVTDPRLGINLLMLVHGEQEFEFFDVVRAGDVLTSRGTIKQVYDKVGKDFLIVETESHNQHGKLVVKGLWTAVIRQK